MNPTTQTTFAEFVRSHPGAWVYCPLCKCKGVRLVIDGNITYQNSRMSEVTLEAHDLQGSPVMFGEVGPIATSLVAHVLCPASGSPVGDTPIEFRGLEQLTVLMGIDEEVP